MSKLDELIAEYCPNGVEYKTIGECTLKTTNIKWKQETRSLQYIDLSSVDRDTHRITETTVVNKENAPSRAQQIVQTGDILFGGTRPMLKRYCIIPEEYDGQVCSTGFCVLRPNNNIILKNWLYHHISSTAFYNHVELYQKGASYPAISDAEVKMFSIPVPPLSVQHEIVRILDNFTELTAELIAELTARKKQYEYYRDELLKPKSNIPMVALKDIATDIFRGSGITREQVTEDGIPCIRYGEIYTTYNTWFDTCVSHTHLENIPNPKFFEHGDILFAITGESVEDIAKSVAYIGNEKCLAGGDIVVLKHNQNPRYLAHVLSTQRAREQKSRGKVKSKVVHSNVPSIEQIEIPLPSLDIQERYANVLDNFESLCNDIGIGLPAEIEARQKQYEYYRELLLTFADSSQFGNVERERERERERVGISRTSEIKLLQYVFGHARLSIREMSCLFRGEYITQKDTTVGDYPVVLGGQEPAYYINKYNHVGEIVTVSRSGASAGYVSYWNTPIFLTDGFGFEAKQAIVQNRFLYYILKNNETELGKMKRGAGVPHISLETLQQTMYDIPSLEEQTRIVSILDRFDTLCSDITSGLPAEIEARQKQYEYYRDQLFNFPKITSST